MMHQKERRSTMKRIAKVELPVIIFKQGTQFVAYTPALDFTTCGDTFEQAKDNFHEGVQMLLDDFLERDVLEEMLRDFGWKKIAKKWMPPAFIASEAIEIPMHVN